MDWRDLAKSVVPTLSGLLPPPFNGLAQIAVKSALGLDDSATEKDIERAIKNASPEQLLALKQAEHNFQLEMERLDVDLEKIASNDRDSARKREVSLSDGTPKVIAALVITGWGVMNYTLFTNGIPQGLPEAVLYRVLGTLDAAVMAVLYYYFGSSNSSQKKDNLMREKK